MLKMLLFLSELESESKKSWKSSHEQHLNRFSPPPPDPSHEKMVKLDTPLQNVCSRLLFVLLKN